jgi:hypothetical protein
MPSSFSTEAAAMLAAVELLARHLKASEEAEVIEVSEVPVVPTKPTVTIATDSLSLLQSLQANGPWRATPICSAIWCAILPLLASLAELRLCFVFGHCECPWQSLADKRASERSNMGALPAGASYRPVWSTDLARTLYTPKREAAITALQDPAALRERICSQAADGKPAPLFLPWASSLSVARQHLLSQLRSGVCGGLGGVRHSSSDPCRLCNTENALARGGKAVEHLFACTGISRPNDITIESLARPSQYAAVVEYALKFIGAARNANAS